jgi:hypothetical protein
VTDETSYYGYTIRQNLKSGRWEIFWKDRRIDNDFASKSAAEEWIDEQLPLNR